MTRLDDRGSPIRLGDVALARLAAALDRDGVVAGALFGSQAAAQAGGLSDVDVAVWLDPDSTVEQRLEVRLELTNAAARALGTDDVDVVVLNDAAPLLVHRAAQSAVRLVDRDARARVRLEADALVQYLDTIPLRDELARGLRHRIEEGRFGRSGPG